MGPVITLMMGRLEDWLRVLTERDGVVVDPQALPWSGVAVFKRAYSILCERGYRARAFFRRHWLAAASVVAVICRTSVVCQLT